MKDEYDLELQEVKNDNYALQEKNEDLVTQMNYQSGELGKLRDLLISYQESEKNYQAQIKQLEVQCDELTNKQQRAG